MSTKSRVAGKVDQLGGYAKPPKQHQFKPGRSGNPRGRPKGSRAIGDVLRDVLRQKIAVTENGKTRRLPVMDVVFRRLANDAIRSDTTAIKLLLTLYDRYQGAGDNPATLEQILAEDKEILSRYLPKAADKPASKEGKTRRKRSNGR